MTSLDLDATTAELPPSASAFAPRAFVLYWGARFLNSFAIQIVSVAVGWQIYDETRDPLLLGLVGLVQFAPALLFVLTTGSVADRFNRRLVMGICIGVEALCTAAIAIFWMLHAARSGNEHVVWPVFVILGVFGIARAFLTPSVLSLMANIVPREAFANAVAWNSSAVQLSFTVGPALGGLIYGISPWRRTARRSLCLPAQPCYDGAHSEAGAEDIAEPRSWDTLLAGVRYIWSQPVVLGAISLDLFAVLLGGATALLPVYARDMLEVGPWGLGFCALPPVSERPGRGVWLVRNPIRDHAGRIMFVGVAVYGLAIMAFGVSTTLWISIPALAIMGAADMVSVNVRGTLVQLGTPDDVRGRVSAVNSVFIGASNELGEFRAGTMAHLIGTVPAVVVGGAGALLIAGLWTRLFPPLLNKRQMT